VIAAVTAPASLLWRCASPVMACDPEALRDAGRSNYRVIPLLRFFTGTVQCFPPQSPQQAPDT